MVSGDESAQGRRSSEGQGIRSSTRPAFIPTIASAWPLPSRKRCGSIVASGMCEFRVAPGGNGPRFAGSPSAAEFSTTATGRSASWGLISTSRNRKTADAAQARLAAIVTLSRDAIVSFDFQRSIVTWNGGAEEIFGFTAAEAIGRDLASIVSQELGSARESIFDDLEAGRLVQDFSTRGRTKAGVDVDLSISASPVIDPAGAIIGGSLIVRDVSTQADADRVMRKHTADLEQRVAERTRELVAAQEEERRRIARDLHDHLGQQLTALRLSLAVCKERAGEDESLAQQLAKAESAATQLDADIEFLAWELQPSQLDRGLVTAIDNYAREWSNHFHVAIDIHTSRLDERRLPPQAALSLYRIAQEALNNVAKHGHATRVAVILEQRDERAVLVIEDNGRGFDVHHTDAGPHAQRLGLAGMHERVKLVGGTLDIESVIGKGATVIVQIPLRAS